ncbi:MAG TPA: hypothetical protein VIA10_05615 [Gaiellaceae bacterium]
MPLRAEALFEFAENLFAGLEIFVDRFPDRRGDGLSNRREAVAFLDKTSAELRLHSRRQHRPPA